MKNKIIALSVFLFGCSQLSAQQWSSTGDNHTSGDLTIGDISGEGVISIKNSNYGKKTLDMVNTNNNIYFTDHTLSFVPNAEWTQVPYIQWYVPNGDRQAYLGWQKDYFNLTLENGYNFSINGGNVGIGTTTPQTNLHLIGTTHGGQLYLQYSQSTPTLGIRAYADAEGDNQLLFYTDVSSSNYPLVLNDDKVGIGTRTPTSKLQVMGDIAIDYGRGLRVDTDWNGNGGAYFLKTGYDGARGGDFLDLFVPGDGLHHKEVKMTIVEQGNVGIGTTSPSHKLEVAGTFRSKEVKVEAAPWPDYVFREDYNLPTIEEIESFIQSNKHLPEVPSAAEVEAEGLKLGEMNALLLKKIEELTLYTIQQEKKLKKQEELEKEIEQLDVRSQKLEEENMELGIQNEELKEGYAELLKRIEKLEKK